ncbi:MAG: TRAP transporter permease [Tistlia sp.]|uniref:TRAP transporter permease n=1 Tax=Tistlia sp. TaxID=3057121 RepID=UPI0034A22723
MAKLDEPKKLSDEELADLVAASDSGARSPTGRVAVLIAGLAVFWSLFQIWIASPLPFWISAELPFSLVLNDTETRSIHLGLALFLAFCAYPAFKRSPRDHVPWLDWILALVAAFCASYLYWFYEILSVTASAGRSTELQVAIGVVGLILLLEATRRALGPPLAVIAVIFLLYVFFGSSDLVPDVIRWGGATTRRAMEHMWLTTEGVFGIALGVSTSFVFLFVLFGSLLDKAGAGNYFINLAFALLGHLRGGPAKAAVVGSAMTGVISGSSIANVVTTGTFTIPLMKRVGFSPEKAGSVEVAASVNGQIMPPVMGAAAFLMVEYVGIPYIDVIKHAFLPAAISYIALLYLVHLEALKSGMAALPKPVERSRRQRLLAMGISVSSVLILAGLVYFGILGIRAILPGGVATPVLLLALFASYVVLVWFASRRPDLALDDPESEIVRLPIAGEVLPTGLHYILPIGVLVWFLMIEQKSPGLSAFYAVALMLVILLTQRPLKALFRGELGAQGEAFRTGALELLEGMIAGARNMIGIAIATATAGIIVGTVTLTGVGQVMSEFVEFISGGNLMAILVVTAMLSLVLGMGLPTTANYIVVSSLLAPVIVELGAANGLIVPLIAVHLFVFYFGIMADVTPPVGLASFAAAAISGGDPIKTGLTAFFYSLRTVILPFLFIFNTDLLLIDVGWAGGIAIFAKATLAMLVFAAATQGYFFARNRIWETVALLLVAFTLFRPGYWLDQVQAPYDEVAPASLFEAAADRPEGTRLRIVVSGPNFNNPDRIDRVTLLAPLADGDDGAQRLEEGSGLMVGIEGEQAVLEEPFPGSTFFFDLQNFDFYGEVPVTVVQVQVPADRMPKEIFYIPGLLLLLLVIFLQRRRATVPAF